MTLYPSVVRTLADAGYSVRDWCHIWTGYPEWMGDVCGCTDSRCIGFHHEEHEECECLAWMLTDAAGRAAFLGRA